MREPEPYKLADRELERITRIATKRIQRTKRRLFIADFDEVNVMSDLNDLYEALYDDSIEAFRRLFKARYIEMWKYIKGERPDEDFLDELFDLYMMEFLAMPNPVVGYAYDTETLRKRDRAEEAIIAAPTKLQKQVLFDKHVRYLVIQISFFIDLVSDEASVRAMTDAGIEKVMWITQQDERVCLDCDEKHGKIYKLSEVPDKPHPRCRCYLRPVLN